MNQISDIIKNRRSIRTYSPKGVSKDLLIEIIKGATWAPSAHNAQPWRFIVIMTWEKKKKLAEAMASKWVQDMIKDAIPHETRRSLIQASIKQFTTSPILLVACITMKDMNTYQDQRRQACEHTLATQSLAATIQNILLIASSKGLGACWYCAPLFCQKVVRNVLKLPQDVEPQALITIGYPSTTPLPPPRKSVKDIVHENTWRGETY